MNAYSKTRTLTAGLLVALAMIVVPTAFAAGKPDDEHRQLGTAIAVDASAGERNQPRAMPTDYAKADVGTKQYGIPRAMPSHFAAAGVTLGQQVGLPRALPSDYAAAPATGFDWTDAAVGAGASSALMLAAIAAWLLVTRRRSDPPSGVGASVVQH